MIQCHLCQVWADFQCIDEKDDDIVGIWCCNNCRQLPETTAALCEKMDFLQRDIALLLKFAHSFNEKPVKQSANIDIDNLCDNQANCEDRVAAIVQITRNDCSTIP